MLKKLARSSAFQLTFMPLILSNVKKFSEDDAKLNFGR